MEHTNEQGALIPYLFYELLERAGGVIDFDAKKMLELIKLKEDRGVAVSILDGVLRVELLDKDDINANES